jgi:cytochrome c biogenesis protein CcdA
MEPLTIAAVGSAFWLGIVTSISPCPLATNIAAMSFLGKRVDKPVLALLAGLGYTLGRVLAYVAVGAFIVKGVLSIPGAANWLQTVMNVALGPLLIVIGVVLLDVIPLRFSGFGFGEKVQKMAAGAGAAAPMFLGVVFALSFCPISAGLFFGSLVPLSLRHDSVLLLPSVFGVGTGLPVVVFAAVLAFGAGSLGRAYDRATVFALWAKRITGVIFILVGVFHILRWNLHLV